MSSPPTYRVLALAGSLRQGSATRIALQVAAQSAEARGGKLVTLDLASPPLPLFEDGVSTRSPAALSLREKVGEADALLVATPVYHDSYSGLLKNALDHLYDELADKVVGLIAVGGGRSGQGQALEHLRAVFRETRSWVIPRQVIIPQAGQAVDTEGKLKDAELTLRLEQLGAELVLRCRQLRPRRAAP